jgi:altronate hydrolase
LLLAQAAVRRLCGGTGGRRRQPIKIASNSRAYARMRDNMDFNAGLIADGEQTIRQAGEQLFELLLRVASGEKTAG